MGHLENHIPAEFTSDRPAVKYSHIEHAMRIADHPVACQLPTPSPRVANWADADKLQTLSHLPGSPKSLDHYLHSDDSQLGLHIVSFTDATLVSLHWPHTLFDGMGKMALLNAWSLMLQGRHDEIPVTYAVDKDPLAELGRHPTEPHKLSEHLMSFFDIVRYGVNNLYRLLFTTLQRRVIYVPAPFLASLRENALQDLASRDEQTLFLSEGDILCAWWARLSTAHLSRDSTRLVTLISAFSLRPALSGDLLRFSSTYISNAVGMIPVLLNAADILNKPLSFVALQIRHSITELGQRGQVEAFASLWRAARYRIPPLFGSSTMYTVAFSNWTKAKLFETNFSAAVIKRKTSDPKPLSKVGKPSYIHHCRFGLVGLNLLIVVGKDAEGNYWLDGCTERAHWSRIEELLAKA